jgi:putative ABC transport system permease protein
LGPGPIHAPSHLPILRLALAADTVGMALGTIRANRLQSGRTVLGVLIGAGVGTAVRLLTPLSVSMPWWSFAIGFGFSGGVGIFFGLVPTFRAARLDPNEALRYA